MISDFLSAFLRLGRVTRLTSSWKGYHRLKRLYRRVLPADLTVRIANFDRDLTLDVNLWHETGFCLWHYPELYEKEAREVFCSAIRPGCTVLDVGANIGIYTLLAAKRGARVFAVEADPVNAIQLRRHIQINGYSDRVTVLEIAATECDKTVPLYRHPWNMGESNICRKGEPSGTVLGRRLDSFNLPPIDVCKMDIEGAELMALTGMRETLSRSPNLRLVIEYAEANGSGRLLIDFLKENFTTLQVLETLPDAPGNLIPPFCNILATR